MITMSKKKELERRAMLFETRAANEDGRSIIYGRPVVYNKRTNIGLFDEEIASGALDDTDLKDVRFLVNHNLSMIPLARSRRNNANSTMQLTVDKEGLAMRAEVDTENNATARELYSAIERGDIPGMSFMFSVEEDKWEGLDTEHPFRTILKIGTIVEVSAVSDPAYEQTEISTRSKGALDNARRAVDTAREQQQSVDTDKLELEKLKAKYLYNI